MSIRTNVSDSLDQVEANQLLLLQKNTELENRTIKLEKLVDLFEQAITALTDNAEENTKDIATLYTNVDLALHDLDALTTNP